MKNRLKTHEISLEKTNSISVAVGGPVSHYEHLITASLPEDQFDLPEKSFF